MQLLIAPLSATVFAVTHGQIALSSYEINLMRRKRWALDSVNDKALRERLEQIIHSRK